MDYLNSLYQISVANGWPRNDSDGLAPFTEGKVAAITNGNWAMGDYKTALGDKLAVAPCPPAPVAPPARCWVWTVSTSTPTAPTWKPALEVALYLTGQNAQLMMMNEAGHVPARTDVEITDPLIQGLVDAFTTGYVRPQVPQLGLYWSNFCGTDEVFEMGVPAADWVASGTEAANK
jgi:maltose-binding protein MalE